MNTTTEIQNDKTTKREKILGEMTDAAREMFFTIERKLVNEDLDTIDNRYEIGHMVLNATNNPNKYGKEIHKTFAELLDMNPDVVYQSRLVASRFNNDDKNRILEMRNGLGQPITWTQLVSIARMPESNTRWELLEMTMENNWNTKDLENEINMRENKDSKSTKTVSKKLGRPLSKPKDLNSLMTQVESMSKKMYKSCSDIWLDEEKGLAAMVEDTVEQFGRTEDKFITRLQANADSLVDLISAMTQLKTDIDKSVSALQSANEKVYNEESSSTDSESNVIEDGPFDLELEDDEEENEDEAAKTKRTITSARSPSEM